MNKSYRINPFNIGDGEYVIYFSEIGRFGMSRFIGVCENFDGSGKCVFWNSENKQMLVVTYRDIMAMYPIKQEKR